MQTLLRTPLFDRHVALGARMVPFAGWEMPVQYEGVIPEHMAVRTDSGVFDVSNMGELEVEGPRAHELLQSTLSNDLRRLADGEAQYALLTNESGGIVDDLIVYRLSRFRFLLIVNAANRESDYEWLKEREIAGSDVRDISDEYALLAVQGPRSLERLGLGETAAFTFAGGEVTSGTHSPMLDRGIGMGYVPAERAAPDTELTIDVRGKPRRARVVKKPIYKREAGPSGGD